MRPSRTAALAAALLVAAGVSAGQVQAQPTTTTPPPPDPSTQAAPPSEGAPPPGPKTTIDADGTYAVGKDILPGVYSSAGPLPDGGPCYWKRVGGDELLDNALTKKPAVVQILASDTTFTTNECQPWALTNGPPPRQAGPADLLGQLGTFIGGGILGGGPTGPPTQSAPAAQAPAAQPAPSQHLAPSGAAPGPG
jgi:hypothetical protein